MRRIHHRQIPSFSSNAAVPVDLRVRLERSRLELRALFRALDQLQLAQDIPGPLHELFELDADLAEALWVLDQPRGKFDLAAMTRDTLASLQRLPAARQAFLEFIEEPARRRLTERTTAVRETLRAEDAYLEIPGRDPHA